MCHIHYKENFNGWYSQPARWYRISGRVVQLNRAVCHERPLFTDSALQTVNQALLYQVRDPDSLKNLYRRLYADVPELPPMPVQSGVPTLKQMPVDLASYDLLLQKGGAANG